MNKHKHHIIPRYRCEELGIDPDFDENIVEVTRKDHALIHWGYKCDDLKLLFEYVIPPQWIIDLIPRGDNRDAGAAVLTARGEIDEIVPLSGENHPNYKDGSLIGWLNDPKIRNTYQNKRRVEPDYKERRKSWDKKWNSKPETRVYKTEWERKKRARNKAKTGYTKGYSQAKKKTETQGEGTLEGFIK